MYQVGTVNRQVENSLLEESRRANLEDCTRDDSKPSWRKEPSWEAEKEMKNQSLKRRKEFNLELIAIN
jgi:hypothetical protein